MRHLTISISAYLLAMGMIVIGSLAQAQTNKQNLTRQQQAQFAEHTYNNCISDFLRSPYKARIKEFGVPYCTCGADKMTATITMKDMKRIHDNRGTLPNDLQARLKGFYATCERSLSSAPLR